MKSHPTPARTSAVKQAAESHGNSLVLHNAAMLNTVEYRHAVGEAVVGGYRELQTRAFHAWEMPHAGYSLHLGMSWQRLHHGRECVEKTRETALDHPQPTGPAWRSSYSGHLSSFVEGPEKISTPRKMNEQTVTYTGDPSLGSLRETGCVMTDEARSISHHAGATKIVLNVYQNGQSRSHAGPSLVEETFDHRLCHGLKNALASCVKTPDQGRLRVRDGGSGDGSEVKDFGSSGVSEEVQTGTRPFDGRTVAVPTMDYGARDLDCSSRGRAAEGARLGRRWLQGADQGSRE